MKHLKILIYLLILLNLVLIGYLLSEEKVEQRLVNVTRVIDGDTIETSIGKVRLKGVNCPEKNERYWREAKSFLEERLKKTVGVEITGEDRYQRNLAYVFSSGKLINQEILRFGFGHLYYYDEDKYFNKMRKAEEAAKENEIGIWKKSADKCSRCINLVELNEEDPGEYLVLENVCSFDCDLSGWTIKDEATHLRKLDFEIKAGEEKKIEYSGRVWNDGGDSLFLRDEKGLLVLFYRY